MEGSEVKPGDIIVRKFGSEVGSPEMEMLVTEVDDELIYVGEKGVGWTFDKVTGAEVDDDLRWGPQYGRTGSQIVAVKPSVSSQEPV